MNTLAGGASYFLRAGMFVSEQAILSDAPPIADTVDAAMEEAVREHSRQVRLPLRHPDTIPSGHHLRGDRKTLTLLIDSDATITLGADL